LKYKEDSTMAAAATSPFVSIEEYLRTDYEPDADYVDGRIEERSVGEWDHGDVQGEIYSIFKRNAKEWGIRTAPEIRVQTSPTRFRVPDVCVVSASEPRQQIVRSAPLLCIEVLSPEDRFARVVRRYQDFLAMGVREVWIFDPASRTAHVLHSDGTTSQHREGALRLEGTPIELQVAEVFGVLDVS
jgi:Uma2 family endonuclease